MRILNLVEISMIRSCKPGCEPASSAAHFLYSTARIRQVINAAWFCSCKLLRRSDECVLLPCLNARPDIFAIMNCSVLASSIFSFDILTWSAESLYSVQWHIRGSACRKICLWCQQPSPKRWFGNMNTTSYCDGTNSAPRIQMTTICHWMKPPHENFLRTPLLLCQVFLWWRDVDGLFMHFSDSNHEISQMQ